MFRGFNNVHIMDCCKDCEKRYLACHDHCVEYKGARKQWDDRNKIIKKERDKALAVDLYLKAAHQRMQKSRKSN